MRPSELVVLARRDPEGARVFERLAALAEHPAFDLIGLAVGRVGSCEPVYVHTKVAIVDDVWATIGSTNIANRSFFGDTELNASFWHADTVRRFRCDLLSAHHGEDLSSLPMAEAIRSVAARAARNRARQLKGAGIHGHAIALDASAWGAPPEE